MADEFPVSADKLRKLVKKSRQMPIAFGFNAGTADEDDEYLAAHARKAPELLGKLAKSEGAGTKAANGTFVVSGSEIHLTCFQTIPQLAKKFKKYLKTAKITLNVVVLDPEGHIIDTDIEVLHDWFRDEDVADDDDDDEDASAPAAAQAAAPAAAPDAPPKAPPAPPPQPKAAPRLDPALAERARRIRDMQGRLPGIPQDIATRLGPALGTAAQLLREGQVAEVDKVLQQVATVMARAQAAAGKARAAATAPRTAAPPPETDDPRLGRLYGALETLRVQAAEVGAEVTPQLDRAEAALRRGEGEDALASMKRAQALMRDALGAKVKWEKVLAILEAPVAQALRGGDGGDLRARWDFAVGMAAEGQWDRALAAVPQIAAAVRGATTPAVPKDVVAFQKSRVLWAGVRQKMLAEADTLCDAIIRASNDDPDAAAIAEDARGIAGEVQKVDSRLQDLLDQITNAPEGAQRDALKKQAAAVIDEYRALIGAGVFTVIDQNPFRPVSVAASARTALEQISRVLAA